MSFTIIEGKDQHAHLYRADLGLCSLHFVHSIFSHELLTITCLSESCDDHLFFYKKEIKNFKRPVPSVAVAGLH